VRHSRTVILLTCILVLALIVYTNRVPLSRALIAGSIYRKHIFTPPPQLQGTSQWHQLREEAQFFWDFAEIPVARTSRLKMLNPTLRPIVKEIGRRQTAGEDMGYSMHIYREVSWRLNFTTDVAATRERIADHYATLLSGAPELALQLIQAPVFHGYTASVLVELREPATLAEMESALQGEHVDLVGAESDPPSNLSAAGQPDLLARVAAGAAGEGPQSQFWLWLAADNLKLAALNAIACANEWRRLRPQGTVQ
jgi:hypothetical protein